MTDAERLARLRSVFGRRIDAGRELEEARGLGAVLLFLGESGYPAPLAEIPDPPPVLYVLGELPPAPRLAVVGARGPTPYGLRMARRLAGEACANGLAVVSGLARGIDTAAHEAALEARGRTAAVLGSGLRRPYPAENRGLLRRIAAEGGAVLSELPLDAPPARENFPKRNRIISGLAAGTLVVEGTERSGSLITAKCALEQGREVFAVPGPADSELSAGPHALIRQGAKLAASLSDVLEELPPWSEAVERAGAAERPTDPARARLLEAIGDGARSFDEIAESTGWEASRLSEVLVELEMEGRVAPLPGQRFSRR